MKLFYGGQQVKEVEIKLKSNNSEHFDTIYVSPNTVVFQGHDKEGEDLCNPETREDWNLDKDTDVIKIFTSDGRFISIGMKTNQKNLVMLQVLQAIWTCIILHHIQYQYTI
jgi:hypothetical protein